MPPTECDQCPRIERAGPRGRELTGKEAHKLEAIGNPASVTNRGFRRDEFVDLYGAVCSIQKSSLATTDAIWFGVNDVEPKVLHSDARKLGIETDASSGWVAYPLPEQVFLNAKMHLSREQVASLLPILQRFVDTGEI